MLVERREDVRECGKIGELGAVGIGGRNEGSVRARFNGDGLSVASCGVVDGGLEPVSIRISGDAARGGGRGFVLDIITSPSMSDRARFIGCCMGGGVGDTAGRELNGPPGYGPG